MPRNDGLYKVVVAFLEQSEYTLHLLNDKKCTFSGFHASLYKCHILNNHFLFPNQEYACPEPVVMKDRAIDYHIINKTINKHRWGHSHQYLVYWVGFSLEHNEWLPCSEWE
ncbi:hypothetical protein J132_01364 [Termitomyces sp. J132]|nr:hypothetical protein J132_01364 [Termitomyces sp. J132]